MKFKKVFKFMKTKVKRIKFEELKKGDLFYLENSNDDIEVSNDGFCIFKAAVNPFTDKKLLGNWGVKATIVKRDPFKNK